jgi:hypothetical protein
VPYSGHAFDLVQLVASVVKADGLYRADPACVFKLACLQLVMEFPGPHEIFEHVPFGNLDVTADWIFLFVGTSSLSHSRSSGQTNQ